jgi:hypothetical protein
LNEVRDHQQGNADKRSSPPAAGFRLPHALWAARSGLGRSTPR